MGAKSATVRSRSINWLRLAVVAVGALILAWLSLAVTLSLNSTRLDPALASRMWPGNSLAQAMLADQLSADSADSRPSVAARIHALASLESQPNNPVAARVLSTVAGLTGDRRAMIRWLAYSERYSRRDLPTQLMQIELAVEQGRIKAALAHYDRALRVFAPQPGLVDVLVTATATPEVRQALVPMLRRDPPWRESYLVQLVESNHTSAATVYQMVRDLKLSSRNNFDRRILSESVALLVKHDQVPLARRLVGISGNDIWNGDFEGASVYPPLDWQLADTNDLIAVIQQGVRSNGGNALFLEARNDASGSVAQQLLSLTPGHYVLKLVSGGGPTSEVEAPTITIACVNRVDPLASTSLVTGPDIVRQFRIGFSVSAGCLDQRVTIGASATAGLDTAHSWIDDVSITSAR